jgi:hypothetical protein
MKNLADSLPVGRVAGRKAKKGNSTRKAKKTRSTPHYSEIPNFKAGCLKLPWVIVSKFEQKPQSICVIV